jgi:ATP-dependent Clp protease ATP-binding subunit ClpB
LITQEALARHYTDRVKLSFLLFDEIEKASDALWQLLLGIMDKATLTLGDNRRVDLSQTVIFLTSNLGAVEIGGLTDAGIGFTPRAPAGERLNRKLERTAVEAARRKFSPEFINRLDKVVVFRPLGPGQLERILDLELELVQRRLFTAARGRFLFHLDDAARGFLLREGTDPKYGARHLKRAIERHLVCPLANLIASEQVGQADMVSVEFDGARGGLIFAREPEKVFVRVAAAGRRLPSASRTAGTTGVPAVAPTVFPAVAPERRHHAHPFPRARRRDR